ncbi:MAG: hypothetical protein ACFE94_04235 [Candidatus Hodarchaeota archaeon]
MIKISEESHQTTKIQIQPEQETCSCCCMGQENVDFKKSEQDLVIQPQSELNK